ncbi:MAG: phosphotransferase [Chloroflexi bacterium]|nr:phosphotransferase [Chloroflexota bacterium]
MQRVPDGFSQRVIDVHADAGADWLSRLAETIAECERRWSLQVLPQFPLLSYNYVAPVTRADGTEAVLKLGVPHQEFTAEMEALRIYDGGGMVRLLEGDPAVGAMLLERLKPGALLSIVPDDEQATSIAVQVMKQIRKPPPSDNRFPTVSVWASGLARLRERFPGATGPIPALLLERAEALFSELIGSMSAPVLLHGDLHHGNILSAEREPWLAIDPKGVVGEAEYEVGAFVRNRLFPGPKPERLLARCVDQFADELGFDRERIVGWSLAQAVLSAWWSFEDSGQVWNEAITCAELLAAI